MGTDTFNALSKKPYYGKPMIYDASDRFDTMKRVYVSGAEDVFRPPFNCNITPELKEKTKEYHDRTAEWIKKTYENQDTPEKRENVIQYLLNKLTEVDRELPQQVLTAVTKTVRFINDVFRRKADMTFKDNKQNFSLTKILYIEIMALTKLKYKRSLSDTSDENRKAPRLTTPNLNVPSTSESRPQSSRSSRRSETPSIFQNNNQGNQDDLYIAVDSIVAKNLLGTNPTVHRLTEILKQSTTISDDEARILAEAHIKGQNERLRQQQEIEKRETERQREIEKREAERQRELEKREKEKREKEQRELEKREKEKREKEQREKEEIDRAYLAQINKEREEAERLQKEKEKIDRINRERKEKEERERKEKEDRKRKNVNEKKKKNVN